jgi:hypothetical protein
MLTVSRDGPIEKAFILDSPPHFFPIISTPIPSPPIHVRIQIRGRLSPQARAMGEGLGGVGHTVKKDSKKGIVLCSV